jgi:hypothetical protein
VLGLELFVLGHKLLTLLEKRHELIVLCLFELFNCLECFCGGAQRNRGLDVRIHAALFELLQ